MGFPVGPNLTEAFDDQAASLTITTTARERVIIQKVIVTNDTNTVTTMTLAWGGATKITIAMVDEVPEANNFTRDDIFPIVCGTGDDFVITL